MSKSIIISVFLFITLSLVSAFQLGRPGTALRPSSFKHSSGPNFRLSRFYSTQGQPTETSTSKEEEEESTSWIELLDPKLLENIEQELLQRYQSQGYDMEQAREQVTNFLSDRNQAEKYIEMRMYTSAVENNALSFGTILQLAGGFFVGFAAIAGPKFFHAAQVASDSANM